MVKALPWLNCVFFFQGTKVAPLVSPEPRAGSGIGTRSRDSFVEGGHRTCSSSESGFYSRYFIVLKKDGGGLRPIIDLCLLNRAIKRFRFKMLTKQTDHVSDHVQGLFFHDRAQGRILQCIYPSSTHEVPGVCFRGWSIPVSGSSVRPVTLTLHFHEVCGCCPGSVATPGHPHTQLYRWLVDFSSVRADGGSASRCRPRPFEIAGAAAERQVECAFSATENHLSGCGMGFDNDAGTVVSCSYRSNSHSREGSERRPVTHCQTVSETVGSDSSCVQHDTFWPAVHETFAVVAQDQGVFPEGEPALHDQGHAAMLTCLRHVEETLVPVSRPVVGGSLSSRNANDGRLPHGLGGGHECPLCLRSVGRPSSYVAHQLPGDVGRVLSSKTLPSRPKGAPCACPHR